MDNMGTGTNEKASGFKSLHVLHDIRHVKKFARLSMVIGGLLLLALFLPWTQNIRSKGELTSYLPQDRPQSIQSVIPGRIEKWYVREGQLVHKGDTIVRISEIKEKFMDPKLLNRLAEQIDAKEGSQTSNSGKVSALARQVEALQRERKLSLEKARNKLKQAELKLGTDSAEIQAARVDNEIALQQVTRADSLIRKGLISLNELEKRRVKVRETTAKLTGAENKLNISRNDLANAVVELSSLDAEYATKITKAESEMNSAVSYLYETQSELAKMNSELAGLTIRSGYYFVTAPLDGYVVQAKVAGVGANIADGEVICTVMPLNPQLAVELYVKAMDIPLLEKGRKVRLQFDGWPAMVFSGWPGYSFGTFGGEIAVIDNYDTQGRYRILVIPDHVDGNWPKQLRVGSGVYGWIMLKDVPIGYELWRQFNGFPPEYIEGITQQPAGNNKPAKDNKE
jgi:multidrug resistance efflux pump